MLLAGKSPSEIAVKIGVARQTVYTWKELLEQGGIDALCAAPARGRPPKLNPAQVQELRNALMQCPSAHGLGAGRWTLKRVGAVIERLHGVKFGTTQIWRILGTLGMKA